VKKWDPDWDLSTVPQLVFFQEAARRMRAAPRPGARRPKLCPYCHQDQGGARLQKEHRVLCPENPRVKKILAVQQKAGAQNQGSEA
jgi:hypothetical protein